MKIIFILFQLSLIEFNLINSESVQIGQYVTVEWVNKGTQTDFILTGIPARGLTLTNSWFGIGFNSKMNPTNVVICKSKSNGSSSIEHYYNNNFQSMPLVASNPKIGLFNSRVQVTNGVLTCSFTRNNTNSAVNYFQIDKNVVTNLIAAGGNFGSNGDIKMHTFDSVSFKKISFNQILPTTTTTVKPTVSTSSPKITSKKA